MNILGINCSVLKGKGRLIVIVSLSNKEVHRFIFTSPSVFSFSKDSGEILNWHRDNILSLITQFKIEAIVVKKTERVSFQSRPKNSDIFKLYMEGVMLSIAGSYGVYNKHYFKNDIKTILEDDAIFEKKIEDIIQDYNKENNLNEIEPNELEASKDLLLSVLAIEKEICND